ncbi:MAG: hypothetical protein V4543_12465 [Bacteroidota bacterium]
MLFAFSFNGLAQKGLKKKYSPVETMNGEQATGAKAMSRLDSLILQDSLNAKYYLDKANNINSLLDNLYSRGSYSNYIFAVYSKAIDSLKHVAVISAVRSMELNTGIANRTRCLKALGTIYSFDSDSLYMVRMANALDTLGYKFPYYAHGMQLGLNYGKNFLVDINYTFGTVRPRNKLIHEPGQFSGVSIGYELNPFSVYGGFKLGGFYSAWPFTFYLSGVVFGSASYEVANPQGPNDKGSGYSAFYIRPEIGYSNQHFQLMLGYNLRGYDHDVSDITFKGVSKATNTVNLALRYNLIGRLYNTAKSPHRGENLFKGFKRKY